MTRRTSPLARAAALALVAQLASFSSLVHAGVTSHAAIDAVRLPGDLDPAFGDNGRVVSPSRGQSIPDGNGKYWVVARVDGAPGRLTVRRLLENGTPDPTFPADGTTVDLYPDAQDYELFYVRRQSTGKIILVGRLFLVDGSTAPLFARLGLDGRLDPSFGRNGIRLVDFDDGASTRYVYGMDIQADDKIVTATLSAFDAKIYPRIVRLHADGDQDTAFGRNGVVYDMPEGTLLLSTLALDDGGLIFGGMSETTDRAVLTRRRSDGSADTAFGDAGFVFLSDRDHPGMRVGSLALSPVDGTVLAGGIAAVAALPGWVAKVLPNGSLDRRFNGGAPLFAEDLSIYSLAVQHNGKIVMHGASRRPSGSVVAIGRVHRDGTFDTSFGTDGVALTPAPAQAAYSNAYSYSELQGPTLFVSDVIAKDDTYEVQLLRYDLGERRHALSAATPE